ncbi:MAG: hypothetical protein IT323_17365 [Anaerolineae bacterium]|nr:hypothetical protein [Anaerolineae bacterium]
MNLDFLTPQLFDGLVIAVIVIGVILAALRIRSDFRRGPRWPEDEESGAPPVAEAADKGEKSAKGQGRS